MENDHPFPQVNQVFENRSHVTKALKRYSMTVHENKLPFHQIKDNGDKVIPKCNNQGCPGLWNLQSNQCRKIPKEFIKVIQH
jgi:hypothetical protein